MVAAGEVGTPVSAVLQSRDPDAPPFAYVKGGGGLFKDMGEEAGKSETRFPFIFFFFCVAGRRFCIFKNF